MIDVRLTYDQLAEAVCASRPAVSKALRELLPTGAVRIRGAARHSRIQLDTQQARALVSAWSQ